VILEGILHRRKYGTMLQRLITAHVGVTTVVYLDISLDETLGRHTLRPQAAEFTAEQTRGWYLHRDVLGIAGERVLGEAMSEEEAVAFIADLPVQQTAADATVRWRTRPEPRPA
jgi:hypothetical protein